MVYKKIKNIFFIIKLNILNTGENFNFIKI
jgi:hypothetical protein